MSVYDLLQVDPDSPLPLAAQLSQQLTWLIASQQIREGEKLPSVRKLAGQLGMSMHTVRAAYQQLEADELVATRQGSGTTVLPFERQRVAAKRTRARTFTIGVLIPAFQPFYAPYLRGLEDAAQNDPSLLFIVDTHDYSPDVVRYLDQLIVKDVDGVIFTSAGLDYVESTALADASVALTPIVSADSPLLPGPAVLFDLEGGGFQATRHLLDHGHSRIGLIAPPLEFDQVAPVFHGYERALTSAGLTVEPALVASGPDFELETGAQTAARLLDLPDPPTAIFAASDYLALGAMQVIKARGLAIPRDIALVAHGETDLAALVDPPLTTVAFPAYELGFKTMTMLLSLIAGEDVEPKRITLDANLVVRQSCGVHD